MEWAPEFCRRAPPGQRDKPFIARKPDLTGLLSDSIRSPLLQGVMTETNEG